MFNGSSYRSLIASNVGNQPDASPAAWSTIAQAANVGANLTAGGTLSASSAGQIYTFTNTSTAAGNRAALLAIAGTPSPNITYSTPPAGSGMAATYFAAMANSTSGASVGNYGDSNNQAAIPIWGNNRSTGATNWGLGVLGTTTSPNGRAVMGQATASASAAGKVVTGVYGEATAAQTVGTVAGVVGSATGASGTIYGVLGTVPSTGSNAGFGVRGENLNTTGGVGVQAFTAAASGRSILAVGSVFIENRSANGSATSGTDGLIVWSNSGASGFNSSGALFTPSDRNVKKGFTSVDEVDVLNKLVATPVTRWHYKNDDATWYMGPMAQDFYANFGLGDKDTVIHTVNADGVAFAAIKGLNSKLESQLKERDEKIASLEARLVNLETYAKAGGFQISSSAGIGAALALPVIGFALLRRRNAKKENA